MCDDKYIIIVRGRLFDTGALTSNFISKDLLESLKCHVGEGKIREKNMTIDNHI